MDSTEQSLLSTFLPARWPSAGSMISDRLEQAALVLYCIHLSGSLHDMQPVRKISVSLDLKGGSSAYRNEFVCFLWFRVCVQKHTNTLERESLKSASAFSTLPRTSMFVPVPVHIHAYTSASISFRTARTHIPIGVNKESIALSFTHHRFSKAADCPSCMGRVERCVLDELFLRKPPRQGENQQTPSLRAPLWKSTALKIAISTVPRTFQATHATEKAPFDFFPPHE